MKAAVMESNNGKSIVLTEDGIFAEIEGSYKVGDVIDYKEWKPTAEVKAKKLRRFAAAACLVLALFAGMFSLSVPSSYACVELGSDYSVRYLLDKDLKVIDVEASEDSGSDLAEDLISDGVIGKDISEAITMAEERTGLVYDAASEPPEISCKDDSAAEKICSDIRNHHSATGKTESIQDGQASAKMHEEDSSFIEPDKPDKEVHEFDKDKKNGVEDITGNRNGEPNALGEGSAGHAGDEPQHCITHE